MTIEEASKKLNMSPQFLRQWIKQKSDHPFGVALIHEGRATYYINEDRLKAWCEGSIK